MTEREQAIMDCIRVSLDEASRYGPMPKAGIASAVMRMRELLAETKATAPRA